jgi:hypothetical protein
MIYLIGVCHAVQDYRWSDNQWQKNTELREVYAELTKKFEAYLRGVIKDYQITLLAEEYNKEALRGIYPKSVLKDIADSLSLSHLYCDPDNKERKQFGIRTEEEREKFWFDKIKMHVNDNILFIAGACHIESFSDLIKKNGYNFSVINEDWEKEKFPPGDC